MKILLVDAFDSFVHIIRQYFLVLGCDVVTIRNNAIDAGVVRSHRPDMIVLGPGPGHPATANYVEIIDEFKGRLPILGVCLGHQAIGLAFGGKVSKATHLMHGKTSEIDHDQRGCFVDFPNPAKVTRYHSLIVDADNFPQCLEVSAKSRDDGYIMGLRHRTLPIESVQFHPESVYTKDGMGFFENFLKAHMPGHKR